MTVAKEIKRMGEAIAVDLSEYSELPQKIQDALKTVKIYPKVVFFDPAITKAYGVFGHSDLKSQEYRSIFRDLKRDLRNAVKDGSFQTDLELTNEDKAGVKTADVEIPNFIEVKNSSYREWTSAKGSSITAKLVSVQYGEEFTFQLHSGKQIKIKGIELAPESLKEAKELAAL